MESVVAVFIFSFLGGFILAGWLAFFAWRRRAPPAESLRLIEAASVTPPNAEEPDETQRLDTRQIGALLAQALPAATKVVVVAPKRVITPNRKVPAIRSAAEAGSAPANKQKEREEEEELLLDLTGL